MKAKLLAVDYSHRIWLEAHEIHVRTGQHLFNTLPSYIGAKVAGTMFDPFHRDLSKVQMVNWVENHLIFNDDGEIIALFDGNMIMWEKK